MHYFCAMRDDLKMQSSNEGRTFTCRCDPLVHVFPPGFYRSSDVEAIDHFQFNGPAGSSSGSGGAESGMNIDRFHILDLLASL